jgi:hypothetical protein
MTSDVAEEKIPLLLVVPFFAAHVPLAILLSGNSRLATLHAVVTIAVALWLAVFSKRQERVAYAAAYITGSEVLWRMTDSQSYWETGKYAVALIFIISIVRNWRERPSVLPVLYFLLLLPSVALTFQGRSFAEVRPLLSSDLSGPFALMIAGCFFSRFSLSKESLLRIFLALIGPIIGVAVVALFGIVTTDDLVFIDGSNFEASGGFGPNQVSAILGVGALAAFLMLLDRDTDIRLRVLSGATMLFLASQSALTFSRGGLFNMLGAVGLASLFLLRDSRTRIQFILAILLVSAISYFFIIPRLDSFTGGALSNRFEDTSTTGREEIARADVEIWTNNPFLGVGPGVASEYRVLELGRAFAAHTEFTRLLAEHGILGLLAMLILATAAVRNVFMAQTANEKAIVVALIAWSFLFMLNAGMRLVAPSLMYGLTFALVRQRRKNSAPAMDVPRRPMETSRLIPQ